MAETYSVVVTGDIIDGFDLGQVKANVGKLFKLSDEKVEKLFAGKPVAIQRGVDKQKAIKVRGALTKAGAGSVVKLNRLVKAKGEAQQVNTAKAVVKKAVVEKAIVEKVAVKKTIAKQAPVKTTKAASKPVKAGKEPEAPKAAVAKVTTTAKTSDNNEVINCPRCGHDQPFVTACGLCKMDLSLHIQRLQRKAKAQAKRRK